MFPASLSLYGDILSFRCWLKANTTPIYHDLRADMSFTLKFNVELDETDVLREHLRTWRSCDARDNRQIGRAHV